MSDSAPSELSYFKDKLLESQVHLKIRNVYLNNVSVSEFHEKFNHRGDDVSVGM